MSISDKLLTVAENQQKVYAAGQKSMVDPTKIIEKTASGAVIRVDDVSEIPHKCTVSVDKDATVTACGKNFIDKDALIYGIELDPYSGATKVSALWYTTPYIPVNPSAQYVASGISSATVCVYNAEKEFIVRLTSNPLNNLPENARYVRMNSIIDGYDTPQLELGTEASAYETYKGNSYTMIAGQTVEVDSICPMMIIVSDSDATITFNYHKSWGVQSEYDRFWDSFQENGNRTKYTVGFGGNCWTDETYNPKYPITATDACAYMYWNNLGITDTKVPITFPNTSSNVGSVFSTCYNLETIRKIIVFEETGYSAWFSSCGKLKNITVEGTIGTNFDISSSTLLTHDSLMSIINALKDYSADESGKTYTLTIGSKNVAKLTDTELQGAYDKGWTVK